MRRRRRRAPYMEEIRTPPGCLRIAFSAETPDGHAIDPEIKDALAGVARWLEDLGHHVEERGLDVDYRRLYAAQRAVSTASFAAEMAERVREVGREPGPDELEPNTWAVLLSGRRRSGEEVMAAWGLCGSCAGRSSSASRPSTSFSRRCAAPRFPGSATSGP